MSLLDDPRNYVLDESTDEEDDETSGSEGDTTEEEEDEEETVSTLVKAEDAAKAAAYESSCDEKGEKESCPICLNRFIGQDLGTPENCNHVFCLECIQEWSKNINTCPIDRTEFNFLYLKYEPNGLSNKKIPVEVRPKSPEDFPTEGATTVCEMCHRGDREDRLLLCDSCDLAWHCECLDPPLRFIPIEEWFCPPCSGVLQNNPPPMAASGLRSRRVIPRTRASETVRTRVQNRRSATYRSPSASTSRTRSAPKKKRRYRRRTFGKKLLKLARTQKSVVDSSKGKVCSNTVYVSYRRKKRRRKQKTRKTKRVAVSRSTDAGISVKGRLTERLGLYKATKSSIMPEVKSQPGPSSSTQPQSGLRLFGARHQLMDFEENFNADVPGPSRACTSQREKTNTSSLPSSVNLLDSIIAGQTILHTKTKNIVIRTDGSLIVKEQQVNSVQSKKSLATDRKRSVVRIGLSKTNSTISKFSTVIHTGKNESQSADFSSTSGSSELRWSKLGSKDIPAKLNPPDKSITPNVRTRIKVEPPDDIECEYNQQVSGLSGSAISENLVVDRIKTEPPDSDSTTDTDDSGISPVRNFRQRQIKIESDSSCSSKSRLKPNNDIDDLPSPSQLYAEILGTAALPESKSDHTSDEDSNDIPTPEQLLKRISNKYRKPTLEAENISNQSYSKSYAQKHFSTKAGMRIKKELPSSDEDSNTNTDKYTSNRNNHVTSYEESQRMLKSGQVSVAQNSSYSTNMKTIRIKEELQTTDEESDHQSMKEISFKGCPIKSEPISSSDETDCENTNMLSSNDVRKNLKSPHSIPLSDSLPATQPLSLNKEFYSLQEAKGLCPSSKKAEVLSTDLLKNLHGDALSPNMLVLDPLPETQVFEQNTSKTFNDSENKSKNPLNIESSSNRLHSDILPPAQSIERNFSRSNSQIDASCKLKNNASVSKISIIDSLPATQPIEENILYRSSHKTTSTLKKSQNVKLNSEIHDNNSLPPTQSLNEDYVLPFSELLKQRKLNINIKQLKSIHFPTEAPSLNLGSTQTDNLPETQVFSQSGFEDDLPPTQSLHNHVSDNTFLDAKKCDQNKHKSYHQALSTEKKHYKDDKNTFKKPQTAEIDDLPATQLLHQFDTTDNLLQQPNNSDFEDDLPPTQLLDNHNSVHSFLQRKHCDQDKHNLNLQSSSHKEHSTGDRSFFEKKDKKHSINARNSFENKKHSSEKNVISEKKHRELSSNNKSISQTKDKNLLAEVRKVSGTKNLKHSTDDISISEKKCRKNSAGDKRTFEKNHRKNSVDDRITSEKKNKTISIDDNRVSEKKNREHFLNDRSASENKCRKIYKEMHQSSQSICKDKITKNDNHLKQSSSKKKEEKHSDRHCVSMSSRERTLPSKREDRNSNDNQHCNWSKNEEHNKAENLMKNHSHADICNNSPAERKGKSSLVCKSDTRLKNHVQNYNLLDDLSPIHPLESSDLIQDLPAIQLPNVEEDFPATQILDVPNLNDDLPETQLPEMANIEDDLPATQLFNMSNLGDDLPATQLIDVSNLDNDLPKTQLLEVPNIKYDLLPATQLSNMSNLDDFPATQLCNMSNLGDHLPATQLLDVSNLDDDLPATQLPEMPNDLLATQLMDMSNFKDGLPEMANTGDTLPEIQLPKTANVEGYLSDTQLPNASNADEDFPETQLPDNYNLEDNLPPTQLIHALPIAALREDSNIDNDLPQTYIIKTSGLENNITKNGTDLLDVPLTQPDANETKSIPATGIKSAEPTENLQSDLFSKNNLKQDKQPSGTECDPLAQKKNSPAKKVGIHRNLPQVISRVQTKYTLKPKICNQKTFSFDQVKKKLRLEGDLFSEDSNSNFLSDLSNSEFDLKFKNPALSSCTDENPLMDKNENYNRVSNLCKQGMESLQNKGKTNFHSTGGNFMNFFNTSLLSSTISLEDSDLPPTQLVQHIENSTPASKLKKITIGEKNDLLKHSELADTNLKCRSVLDCSEIEAKNKRPCHNNLIKSWDSTDTESIASERTPDPIANFSEGNNLEKLEESAYRKASFNIKKDSVENNNSPYPVLLKIKDKRPSQEYLNYKGDDAHESYKRNIPHSKQKNKKDKNCISESNRKVSSETTQLSKNNNKDTYEELSKNNNKHVEICENHKNDDKLNCLVKQDKYTAYKNHAKINPNDKPKTNKTVHVESSNKGNLVVEEEVAIFDKNRKSSHNVEQKYGNNSSGKEKARKSEQKYKVKVIVKKTGESCRNSKQNLKNVEKDVNITENSYEVKRRKDSKDTYEKNSHGDSRSSTNCESEVCTVNKDTNHQFNQKHKKYDKNVREEKRKDSHSSKRKQMKDEHSDFEESKQTWSDEELTKSAHKANQNNKKDVKNASKIYKNTSHHSLQIHSKDKSIERDLASNRKEKKCNKNIRKEYVGNSRSPKQKRMTGVQYDSGEDRISLPEEDFTETIHEVKERSEQNDNNAHEMYQDYRHLSKQEDRRGDKKVCDKAGEDNHDMNREKKNREKSIHKEDVDYNPSSKKSIHKEDVDYSPSSKRKHTKDVVYKDDDDDVSSRHYKQKCNKDERNIHKEEIISLKDNSRHKCRHHSKNHKSRGEHLFECHNDTTCEYGSSSEYSKHTSKVNEQQKIDTRYKSSHKERENRSMEIDNKHKYQVSEQENKHKINHLSDKSNSSRSSERKHSSDHRRTLDEEKRNESAKRNRSMSSSNRDLPREKVKSDFSNQSSSKQIYKLVPLRKDNHHVEQTSHNRVKIRKDRKSEGCLSEETTDSDSSYSNSEVKNSEHKVQNAKNILHNGDKKFQNIVNSVENTFDKVEKDYNRKIHHSKSKNRYKSEAENTRSSTPVRPLSTGFDDIEAKLEQMFEVQSERVHHSKDKDRHAKQNDIENAREINTQTRSLSTSSDDIEAKLEQMFEVRREKNHHNKNRDGAGNTTGNTLISSSCVDRGIKLERLIKQEPDDVCSVELSDSGEKYKSKYDDVFLPSPSKQFFEPSNSAIHGKTKDQFPAEARSSYRTVDVSKIAIVSPQKRRTRDEGASTKKQNLDIQKSLEEDIKDNLHMYDHMTTDVAKQLHKRKRRHSSGLDILNDVANDIVASSSKVTFPNDSSNSSWDRNSFKITKDTKVEIKKADLKQQIADEVKLVLKPFFSLGVINKEDYKDILRRAVPKVFMNCGNVVNPEKIKKLVLGYVTKLKGS